MKHIYYCFLLCSTILISNGCNNAGEHHDTTPNDTVEKHDTTISRRDKADQEMNEFKESSKRRMDELDRKIDSMEVKWKDSREDNKKKYAQRRDEMKKKSQDLRTRLDSSRKQSDEKWDQFKREFNHDMDQLGNSIEDLFKDNKK